MSTPQSIDDTASTVHELRGLRGLRGLRYARGVGYILALLLWVLGITGLIQGLGTFDLFKAVYFVLYGLVLCLPFARMSERTWRVGYALLIGMSALFVFVMIAVVMFAYMAAADRGERLGIPGFEGMLIFFALLQVPVVLFQRKPDLLD
ncbi:hypothetical protein QEH59_16435 [Coraliomargarita sp. SDUM461004]|uniref:DUF805 domain-containing protein n=1 Tax=Thalassobacterium sedimentorum TaxID=3041258 RepID=A0ABU1AMJ4_9BACT|nr:hypothetical protein [Coraliomargarita sp. SDUM461004]MDQ8196025.1 hypothetical protein [Coraliomargarita sp. SDUM461004]